MPDGSYYTSVPKAVIEAPDLKGGELFPIKVNLIARKISTTIIEIPE
jgi:hypothetical protein